MLVGTSELVLQQVAGKLITRFNAYANAELTSDANFSQDKRAANSDAGEMGIVTQTETEHGCVCA